ncbi:MAG: 30S ribosomal protein S20 [Minisyncoccota bacterium]
MHNIIFLPSSLPCQKRLDMLQIIHPDYQVSFVEFSYFPYLTKVEIQVMPIKQSAKKYMRVTARKTVRNKIATGIVKSAIKKTEAAVHIGNVDVAQEWLKKAIKSIDKAAQKKIIKKNTAARKKSRLNALVKKAVVK